MGDSVKKRIIKAVFGRVQAITVLGGFNTDLGSRVYRGRRSFDPETETMPVASVWAPESEASDADKDHPERRDAELRIAVEGFAIADEDHPQDTAEDMIADIKRAVLLKTDRYIGVAGGNNLASDLTWSGDLVELPEDGSKIVSVKVFFAADYPEFYGDPEYIV